MTPRTAYLKMNHAWKHLRVRSYRPNASGVWGWQDAGDGAAHLLIYRLAHQIEGDSHPPHLCKKCPLPPPRAQEVE